MATRKKPSPQETVEETETVEELSFPPIKFSITDNALAQLADKYSEVPDLTSLGVATIDDPDNKQLATEYRNAKKALVAAIAEVRGYRTSIESHRKELVADALKFQRDVNGEAKRITEKLVEIESPMKAAKQADDERIERQKEQARLAEEARIAAIKRRVAFITDAPMKLAGQPSEKIMEAVKELRELVIDEELYEEFTVQAKADRGDVVLKLQTMYETKLAEEQRFAELERQAKEAEEMRKKFEAQEAERKAKEEEARKAEEARRQEEQAELLRQQKELQEKQEEFQRQQAEFLRQQQAAAPIPTREPVEEPAPETTDRGRFIPQTKRERDIDAVSEWAKKLRFIDGPDGITDPDCLTIINSSLTRLEMLAQDTLAEIEKL
jgi:hypothetical protein